MKPKTKRDLKTRFIKLSQTIYLTLSFYFQNNLGVAAGSCTFGFVFSFIPIIMLILTSCIGLMKSFPEIVEWISEPIYATIGNVFDIQKYIDSISQGVSVSGVNILLVFFIIWMARKLFASIIQAMRSIFNTVAPSRPVLNQILTFAGELVLIVICTVVFLAAFLTRQILTLPVFVKFRAAFPLVFSSGSKNVIHLAFYLILFIFTTICYRVGSGTKPSVKVCLTNSLLCIGVFYIVVWFISRTINKANYSTIYGVLSNLMILLFEVWFFFSIFVFFAQVIYVWQYLDSLLIGEIYLLPNNKNLGTWETLRRILFINPSALMTDENVVVFHSGETIYDIGSEVSCVYYIYLGSVLESRNNIETRHKKGDSFGECELIMKTKRISRVIAETDCTLLRIPTEDFEELIERNPKAAAKAISTISSYTEKIFLPALNPSMNEKFTL